MTLLPQVWALVHPGPALASGRHPCLSQSHPCAGCQSCVSEVLELVVPFSWVNGPLVTLLTLLIC